MAGRPRGRPGLGDRVHRAHLDALTAPRASLRQDDQGAPRRSYRMLWTGEQACAAALAGADRHGAWAGRRGGGMAWWGGGGGGAGPGRGGGAGAGTGRGGGAGASTAIGTPSG